MSGSPQVTPQEVAGLLFKPRLADTKAHDLSGPLVPEGYKSPSWLLCVWELDWSRGAWWELLGDNGYILLCLRMARKAER